MNRIVAIAAHVAAAIYTVVIVAMVWFTFAWGGFDQRWQFSELLVFGMMALSPIAVCVLCFRRVEA